MCHVCVCVFQTDIKCELVCVRLLSRQSRSCFLGEEVLKQDYIQDHRELVTIIPPLYELFMKIFLFIFYPQIWECICFGWAKWQWKINLDSRHKERRKTVRLPKTALLITLFCQLVKIYMDLQQKKSSQLLKTENMKTTFSLIKMILFMAFTLASFYLHTC